MANVFVTKMVGKSYKKLTVEDLFSGAELKDYEIKKDATSTATYRMWIPKNKGLRKVYPVLFKVLQDFKTRHADLYAVEDRHKLYRRFFIPKHSGGLREINAPEPALMEALRELKYIFETDFNAMYHTAAFAYIKGRCPVDAVKKHQSNNSHWFMAVDFHDFFGSTSKEFVMSMLTQIFPFNVLAYTEEGTQLLSETIDLCFLDGGLPQGTPISPLLTNLIMIPIDYTLRKELSGKGFVYTRYADDMLISHMRDFKVNEIENLIIDVLNKFDAPYTFKKEKTKYGSRAGSNWHLGVMLNKDNEITIGHKNKKHYRSMISSFIMDMKHERRWELNDVQVLLGLTSYYRGIEPDYIDSVIEFNNKKYGVDVMSMMKYYH